MITRIALMLFVIATLCCGAFSLGSLSSHPQATGATQSDPSGLPPEHPVVLALNHQHDLALNDDQTQKIIALRDQMAAEFAPFREQANSIQQRMQELQQSASPDPAAEAKLKQEADALGTQLQPIFERYGQEVGKLLTDEQRQKLMQLSREAGHPSDEQEFVLNTIVQSRDQLGITPQQFTQLLYLQADFLRAFAPVREKVELLQIEIQERFAKPGKPPTSDYVQRGEELKKQVATLQSEFSGKAVKNVLLPDQRAKLEELLHGHHRSEPHGG